MRIARGRHRHGGIVCWSMVIEARLKCSGCLSSVFMEFSLGAVNRLVFIWAVNCTISISK